MVRDKRGRCPYTKSGNWLDDKVLDIIESALRKPNPKCPTCKVASVLRGSGEIAWYECPKCHGTIGGVEVM